MEGACLVLDAGTGTIKAGFGGSESPSVYRCLIGRAKHQAALPQTGFDGGDVFFANEAEKYRGVLKLEYPVTNGVVRDWKSLGDVLTHVYSSIGVSGKDHPVLCTEAALCSKPQRARLGQLLFEENQHPAVLFATQGLLSLYAAGSVSGMVLDIGDGVAQTCPVYEGYCIRDAVRRVDFGGRDVTAYLRTLLRQYGMYFDTSAEFDIVRTIKEQKCQISVSTPSKEGSLKVKHRLPDGSDIVLGSELTQAGELLFNPSLIGREHGGAAVLVSDSIKLADMDVRRELYQNILLAGGSSAMNGFCPRFLSEMTRMTPRDCKVRVLAPGDRHLTAWIGGSFLSQLSTFKQMTVKKSDYNEHGENILHSRVFC